MLVVDRRMKIVKRNGSMYRNDAPQKNCDIFILDRAYELMGFSDFYESEIAMTGIIFRFEYFLMLEILNLQWMLLLSISKLKIVRMIWKLKYCQIYKI